MIFESSIPKFHFVFVSQFSNWMFISTFIESKLYTFDNWDENNHVSFSLGLLTTSTYFPGFNLLNEMDVDRMKFVRATLSNFEWGWVVFVYLFNFFIKQSSCLFALETVVLRPLDQFILIDVYKVHLPSKFNSCGGFVLGTTAIWKSWTNFV